MSSAISVAVRQAVYARAGHRCEYCRTPRQVVGMPLVIDHIVPKARGGSDDPENLCAACYRCNQFKGVRTESIDPASGQLTALFHPRRQTWSEHFLWANGGTHIVGITPSGRASALALRLNNEYVVEARAYWTAVGLHPPSGE